MWHLHGDMLVAGPLQRRQLAVPLQQRPVVARALLLRLRELGLMERRIPCSLRTVRVATMSNAIAMMGVQVYRTQCA